MIRENKYLVLKNADIEKHLSDEHQLKLDLFTTKIRIGRLNDGKQDQQYVVVAADWPMYETVWQMVEAFVDGKPNELEISQAENAALKERVVTLEKLQGVALIESLRAEIERLKEAGSIYKNNNIIRQENHSLQQELAALKAENEWQPIETAPKDTFVLLAGPSGYTTIKTVFATGRMCSDYHKGRWIDHANDDLTDGGFEPTHWMPLPKPPAIAQGDK